MIARLLVILVLLSSVLAAAQSGSDGEQATQPPTTMFDHPDNWRVWISGQVNVIFQAHPDFPAAYSGPNSLRPQGESKTSEVFTLYTGLEATRTTEIMFDLESSGGRGISDALGLAGFTNLDVVRNPELGRTPYIARAYIRQIIPLSREQTKVQRGILNVFRELPAKRLEIRFGKFSLADFFDLNSAGSDSHLQFMNWTVDNNGGYDYAANTRGYTIGAMAELVMPGWSLRFCEALMPTVANGIDLDFHLARARAENVEFELRKSLIRDRNGALRLFSYVNHANMGVYREANAAFLAGVDPVPDITAHRHQGSVKYGFGVNAEQELTDSLRVFGRFGWNEGQHESFAYTEVNQTFLFGGDLKGERWRRGLDKIGVAFVSNGISRDHQLYLKLGGSGFLLGDGTLNYGRENIVEGYYNAHLWRGIFAGFDLQHISNPGYNRDRGPVIVPALRLHIDL